jgi:hypothetical protein
MRYLKSPSYVESISDGLKVCMYASIYLYIYKFRYIVVYISIHVYIYTFTSIQFTIIITIIIVIIWLLSSDEASGLVFDEDRHVGLMAQDVQQVLPEVVHPIHGGRFLSVDYTSIVPLLIEVRLNVFIHICIYAYVDKCMYVCICLYVYVYIYIYVCVYICIYTYSQCRLNINRSSNHRGILIYMCL